jgi:hypothetical protein
LAFSTLFCEHFSFWLVRRVSGVRTAHGQNTIGIDFPAKI